ncbi:DUF5710 domain-containing protein [Glaciimonas immobilis]
MKLLEEAKAIGARWDRQQQSWYVPINNLQLLI